MIFNPLTTGVEAADQTRRAGRLGVTGGGGWEGGGGGGGSWGYVSSPTRGAGFKNVNRFGLAVRRQAGKRKDRPRFDTASALLSLLKGCGLWTVL